MISNATRAAVSRATVRFTAMSGQGVVVPNGLIATAAHVIDWDGRGGMALGDRYLEEFESGGRRLKAQVYAVEPVSDIALLGAPDDQGELETAFEEWCDGIPSIRLWMADPPLREWFPIHVLAHTGDWITGRAQQHQPYSRTCYFETTEAIQGGTSGGPVVTDDGRLLGVVSNAGGSPGEPETSGMIPRLYSAAPLWSVERMTGRKHRHRR
jgi:S1-C subfamily serine protease